MSFDTSYIYNLVDKITPSLRKINKSLRSNQGELNKTASKAKRSFRAMSRAAIVSFKKIGSVARRSLGGIARMFTSKFAIIGGALLATFGASKIISTIAGFGQQMSNVQALTGATGEELKKMRLQARAMGATTQFSAKEAAGGMAFLAQAGFSVNEIMQAAPKFLNLAAAGNLDLANAMDIASNVMSAFGIKAKESQRISDVLAQTASMSNTNIQQLGDAFISAAPAAKAAGISLEEASAALGVLAQNGIRAFRAGEKFKILTQRLIKPVGEGAKQLKAFGLAQDGISTIGRGLAKSLDIIRDKVSKLGSDQKKAEAITALFGQEGFTTASIMLGFGKTLDKFTTKNLKAYGTAAKQATIRNNNLIGDFRQLKSAIAEVVIGTGETGLTK